MATQSTTLRNCLQFAADDARRSFAQCIDDTIAAMQEAEGKSMTSARRNELTLAWRTLSNHKDVLTRRYPDMLRGALEGESAIAAKASDNPSDARFEPSRPGFEDSTDSEFGFEEDSLTLVDDTQLSQAIETSRLLQRVTAIIDPGLPLLDGLVSSAMGLPNIAPGLNPVRPEVFVRTLRSVLSESGAEMSTVTVWFSHMAAPFSAELKVLYEKLIKQLKDDGVQPVKYKVGMAPDAASAGGAGGAGGGAGTGTGGAEGGGYGPGGWGGPGGGSGDAAGAGPGGPGQYVGGYMRGGESAFAAAGFSGPVEIIDLTDESLNAELFRQFFSTPLPQPGTPRQRRGLAPAFYQAVQRELAQLSEEQDTEVLPDNGEEFRDLPAVERPRRYVDVTMSLNSPVWGDYGRAKERALVRTQLKAEATEVDQVLGMEMVRQLVNEVARDKRLLGPMREAIIALEPALLRLAMIDPKFFTEAGHAGRRLIERVAQRSFRYNDEFAREFEAFYDPVGASFNDLNQLDDVADAKPFEEALAKLEEVWQEEDAKEAAPRNAMLEALRFAEERQSLADQLAYEISQRTDLDLVPAVILDFLYGRWTLVMAHARLKDTKNQLDPGGYGSLISDLLWSTKHDLTLNQPAKLIQLIPPMVRKINQGLDMLGQDAAEKQSFFDTLERLHKPVLDLCRTRNRQEWPDRAGFRDTLPAAPEAPATAEERVAKPAAQPWFGKQVLQDVGFEEPLAVSSEFANSAMLPDSMFDSSSLPLDSGPAPLDSGSTPLEGLPAEGAAPKEKSADEEAAERAKLTPAQMIKGLRTGVWVDLYSQQAWLRAQLVWASSKRTLFMFQSHGGRPHSMTRRSCERLIRTRHLRPVAMQEVVVRALEAIAAENEIALPAQSESVAQAIASQVLSPGGEDRLDSGPPDSSPGGDGLKLEPPAT